MKMLILIILTIMTFSIGRTEDNTRLQLTCSQIAFDLVSKKLMDIEEQNQYIKSLNRLDQSLAELSKKNASIKEKIDFRSIPPVFDHKVDVMTINYMSKVMQMIDEQQDQKKQVTIMQIALNNLSLEYHKLIPEFMKKCQSVIEHDQTLCSKAKTESDKLSSCYNGNEEIVSWVETKSPYFLSRKTI